MIVVGWYTTVVEVVGSAPGRVISASVANKPFSFDERGTNESELMAWSSKTETL